MPSPSLVTPSVNTRYRSSLSPRMISPAGGPSRNMASRVVFFTVNPGAITLFAIAFLFEEGPAADMLVTGASLFDRVRVCVCAVGVGFVNGGAGGGGSLRAEEAVRFCHRWRGGTGGASGSGELEERVCADWRRRIVRLMRGDGGASVEYDSTDRRGRTCRGGEFDIVASARKEQSRLGR
jgi:hypothetical protein